MATKSDIMRRLKWNKQDEHLAVAIWSEKDVLARARERGMKISKKIAQMIIDSMDDKQDCSLGISWGTIDVYLDDVKYEQKTGEKPLWVN